MSESESVGVRTSGADLEVLKGLVDFLSGDFYDTLEATKDIPSTVLREVMDLDRIAEPDRRAIYLELGAIFGLKAALEWAYREGATYGYFSQREHVMEFLRLMVKATEALKVIDENNDSLDEAAARRVYSILQDIELGLQSIFLALLRYAHNGSGSR
jgi:hypothetical protein